MPTPLWVTLFGIGATWVIAIAAIWGEWIRARLFQPALRLELLTPIGEYVAEPKKPKKTDNDDEANDDDDTQSFIPTRYYRLRLTNLRRHPAAHEVEVLLTALEKRGQHEDPEPTPTYRGLLPFKWRHSEVYGRTRTIGPDTEAHVEFLFVQPGLLTLTPILVPHDFEQTATAWLVSKRQGTNLPLLECAPIKIFTQKRRFHLVREFGQSLKAAGLPIQRRSISSFSARSFSTTWGSMFGPLINRRWSLIDMQDIRAAGGRAKACIDDRQSRQPFSPGCAIASNQPLYLSTLARYLMPG